MKLHSSSFLLMLPEEALRCYPISNLDDIGITTFNVSTVTFDVGYDACWCLLDPGYWFQKSHTFGHLLSDSDCSDTSCKFTIVRLHCMMCPLEVGKIGTGLSGHVQMTSVLHWDGEREPQRHTNKVKLHSSVYSGEESKIAELLQT